jgi:hypothetical protein
MIDLMRRCAIFTLAGYYNYGNRLVCAATCKIFASLGVKAEIILIENENANLPFFVKLRRKIKKALRYRFDKILVGVCPFLLKYVARKIQKHKYAEINRLRKQRFIAFSSEHIIEKGYGLSTTHFPPSFPDKFDFFVIGGDQVWNPFFECADVPGSVYFLPFLKDSQRAFMFSTSFGISKEAFFAKAEEIPGLLDAYRASLSKMAFISCREEAGVEIIRELAGRGEVLVDPTMTLTREEWLSIAKEPAFLNHRLKGRNGFILLYFLGNLPRLLKEKIIRFCKDKNFELIAVNDPTDREAYITDPAEFVYLIAKARTIYTDSFHGAVFSLLLETVFFVFERSGDHLNMMSRMDTLLRKFDLEKRLIRDVEGFHPEDANFSMDFSKPRAILSEERKKAILFLKTAFNKMEYPNADYR